MKLEKGMIFEIKDLKILVLEVAKHAYKAEEIVVYKNLNNNLILCIESYWFEDAKIWGGLND